jgi:AcrR family transcriptional regulator
MPHHPSLKRRNRAEARADTLERLLDAAAEVFRRDGYHGATLERVAATAGHTKGAVYAAFDSKADLFFALLARRGAERRAELRELLAGAAATGDFVADTASRFAHSASTERDWWSTVIEFMIVVGRDESLRQRYREHRDALREMIVATLEEWSRQLGREPTIPPNRLATMVIALHNGMTLESLVAPGEIGTQEFADAQSAIIEALLAADRRA